ncbi:MAG: tetratricopeptide repeat protein [Pseudomonadota bacterium]
MLGNSVIHRAIGLVLMVSLWLVPSVFAAPKPAEADKKAPPRPAAEIVAEAKEHYLNGRFSAAVRSASAAIRLDKNRAEAYRIRGEAHDRLGLRERAVRDYTAYLDLNPKEAKVYIWRGDANNHLLNHEAALKDYEAALALNPKSTDAYIGKGLAYVGLERYTDAIKAYQWVLTQMPNNAEVLGNMGLACMMAGRPLTAVTYFERALASETDPQWRLRIEGWLKEIETRVDAVSPKKAGQAGRRTGDRPKEKLW